MAEQVAIPIVRPLPRIYEKGGTFSNMVAVYEIVYQTGTGEELCRLLMMVKFGGDVVHDIVVGMLFKMHS
jgi:hypothetical protein